MYPDDRLGRSLEVEGYSFYSGGSGRGELPPGWPYPRREGRAIAWMRFLLPCVRPPRGRIHCDECRALSHLAQAYVDIISILSQQSHTALQHLCVPPPTLCLLVQCNSACNDGPWQLYAFFQCNGTQSIKEASSIIPILGQETDPVKLHDLANLYIVTLSAVATGRCSDYRLLGYLGTLRRHRL